MKSRGYMAHRRMRFGVSHHRIPNEIRVSFSVHVHLCAPSPGQPEQRAFSRKSRRSVLCFFNQYSGRGSVHQEYELFASECEPTLIPRRSCADPKILRFMRVIAVDCVDSQRNALNSHHNGAEVSNLHTDRSLETKYPIPNESVSRSLPFKSLMSRIRSGPAAQSS